jgi:hypothetical protein
VTPIWWAKRGDCFSISTPPQRPQIAKIRPSPSRPRHDGRPRPAIGGLTRPLAPPDAASPARGARLAAPAPSRHADPPPRRRGLTARPVRALAPRLRRATMDSPEGPPSLRRASSGSGGSGAAQAPPPSPFPPPVAPHGPPSGGGGGGGGRTPPPAPPLASPSPPGSGRPSSSSSFVPMGFRPGALVDSLLHPLKPEMRTNITDPGKAEALRAAFCLPPAQVRVGERRRRADGGGACAGGLPCEPRGARPQPHAAPHPPRPPPPALRPGAAGALPLRPPQARRLGLGRRDAGAAARVQRVNRGKGRSAGTPFDRRLARA